MELEDWQYDLQRQLQELRSGRWDSSIAMPLGCEPTEQDLVVAGEIIIEAGCRMRNIRPDGIWIIAEVMAVI